jgi:23S rRNA (guanosine2251-2'-O)-methyltransferase
MRKLQVEELNRIDLATFHKSPKIPVMLLLDNIRSGHNVGAAFRTADAFALKRIYLSGITAVPPNKEIHKTALGATESVEWHYFTNTLEAIQELKKLDYKLIGIEQTTESMLLHQADFAPQEKIVFVFGNEVNGISEEILPHLSSCIEIPQWGTKHSLNVSVCIGIVVWDYLMKTNQINKS